MTMKIITISKLYHVCYYSLGLLQNVYGKKYNGQMWMMVKDSINQKGRDLKAKERKLNEEEEGESDEF